MNGVFAKADASFTRANVYRNPVSFPEREETSPTEILPLHKSLVAVSHFLSHTACLRSPLSVGNETVGV